MVIKRLKEKGFTINVISVIRFVKKAFEWRRKRIIHGMGFRPDQKDDRDLVYKIRRITRELPATTNRENIAMFPYRYDQGQIGSCVGHGVCAAFRRVLQINQMPDFDPSRLFAYFIARRDKKVDEGASIRDAFRAMNRAGLCSEKTWPYIERKFAVAPSKEAWKEAMDHQTIRYEKIWPVTKDTIRDAVSSGYPVVYGKMIYESFMSQAVARTGEVPMPNKKAEQMYGGHCMIIFDYDEVGTVELNSWGKNWGQKGLCRVPWNYVLDTELCQDFWVIYLTE